jgi:hypothetical protein
MAPPRRSWTGLGAIAVVGAIAAMLIPTAAEGSFPGANGVIAYSAEHSIWAVDPATGDQLRLTSGPEDSAPSFSPSGDLLTFQRRTTTTLPAFHPTTAGAASPFHPTASAISPFRSTAGGVSPFHPTADARPPFHPTTSTLTVYVAYADGSNPTPLVAGSEPAFSPTGTQIVFVRPSGLFLTGVAPGSPVRRLTDHPGDRTPRWSSKGSIVFQRADGAGSELDIVAPPSSHIRRLFTYHRGAGDDDPIVMWPEWSPNGKSISVALCEPGSVIPPVETVPSIVSHASCAPDVWAPAGGTPLEAGAGALRGKPDSSCPPFIKGGANEDVTFFVHGKLLYQDEGPNWPIAWQPLHPGTLRVPTVPCEEDKERENEPTEAVSPAILQHGGQLCAYFRRRHRKICHRT